MHALSIKYKAHLSEQTRREKSGCKRTACVHARSIKHKVNRGREQKPVTNGLVARMHACNQQRERRGKGVENKRI